MIASRISFRNFLRNSGLVDFLHVCWLKQHIPTYFIAGLRNSTKSRTTNVVQIYLTSFLYYFCFKFLLLLLSRSESISSSPKGTRISKNVTYQGFRVSKPRQTTSHNDGWAKMVERWPFQRQPFKNTTNLNLYSYCSSELSTLGSVISVALRLLIFGIFSWGYGLIKDLILMLILGGYVYSFGQIFSGGTFI